MKMDERLVVVKEARDGIDCAPAAAVAVAVFARRRPKYCLRQSGLVFVFLSLFLLNLDKPVTFCEPSLSLTHTPTPCTACGSPDLR